MALGDGYRIKAAELSARARAEKHPAIRKEYQGLCLAYLRLADQADRNSKTDVVYETPPRPPSGDDSENPLP